MSTFHNWTIEGYSLIPHCQYFLCQEVRYGEEICQKSWWCSKNSWSYFGSLWVGHLEAVWEQHSWSRSQTRAPVIVNRNIQNQVEALKLSKVTNKLCLLVYIIVTINFIIIFDWQALRDSGCPPDMRAPCRAGRLSAAGWGPGGSRGRWRSGSRSGPWSLQRTGQESPDRCFGSSGSERWRELKQHNARKSHHWNFLPRQEPKKCP